MAHEMAFDDVANAQLTSEERAPAAVREERSVAFWGLMMFTFVLFIAPQTFIPGLAGLMPAKLAMGVAMGAYLLGGQPFPVTRTVQYGLAFVACAIISIPLGFWPGGSVDVFFDLLGKSLTVFILIGAVVDTPRRLKILIGSMIAFGTVAAVYAVNQYRTGMLDPTGQRIAGFESPLATNPNDLALTLNILLALALGLLPTIPRGTRRVLLQVAIASFVAGIVASFSRGGFLTLGILGLVWAVQTVRTRGIQSIGVLLLLAIVIMLAAPAQYTHRLWTIIDTEADETGSATERWEGMNLALGYIAERPFFGMGLGNSRHVTVSRRGPDTETHNAYLKAGAELGVVGLAVYVLFIGSAYTAARTVRRRALRRPDGRELASLARGVELSLVAFAVGAFFSPVPYHFYFYYPAGLAVALTMITSRAEAEAAPAADEA
jgi:O-antigen ligase